MRSENSASTSHTSLLGELAWGLGETFATNAITPRWL